MPRLGFIAALPPESATLAGRRVKFDTPVELPTGHIIMVSGTGPVHGARAAAALVNAGAEALLSWGCAGALAPDLRPGHLVLPDYVLGAGGVRHHVATQWRTTLHVALNASMPLSCGAIAESHTVIADPAAKHALKLATGAIAVDMESAAIARVAASSGLPFLIVRAIADHADMSLPAAVTQTLDNRGDVVLTRLLGYALRQPAQFIELFRLGRAFGAAASTLRRVRILAGDDLCHPAAANWDLQISRTR